MSTEEETEDRRIDPHWPNGYYVSTEEREPFKDHWIVADLTVFRPGDMAFIAIYPPKADGHLVNVYCTACPERIYTLDVAGRTDGGGTFRAGWKVKASGMPTLVALMAQAIAEGMMLCEPVPEWRSEEARKRGGLTNG